MNKKLISKLLLFSFFMQVTFEASITNAASGEEEDIGEKIEKYTAIAISGATLLSIIVSYAKGKITRAQALGTVRDTVASAAVPGAGLISLSAALEQNGHAEDASTIRSLKGNLDRAFILKQGYVDIAPLLQRAIPDISQTNIGNFIKELALTGDVNSALGKAGIKVDSDVIKGIQDVVNKNKKAFSLVANPTALKEYVDGARAEIRSKISAIDAVAKEFKVDTTQLKNLKEQFAQFEKGDVNPDSLKRFMDLVDNVGNVHENVIRDVVQQKLSSAQNDLQAIKKDFSSTKFTKILDIERVNTYRKGLTEISESLKKGQLNRDSLQNLDRLSNEIVEYHNKVATDTNPSRINPFGERINPLPTSKPISSVITILPHELPIVPVRPVEPVRPIPHGPIPTR